MRGFVEAAIIPAGHPVAIKTQPKAERLNAACCVECGGQFEHLGQGGAFCGRSCRMAWHNRRARRGAELYDLFMALRFDRSRSRVLSLYTALCRAARLFRDEDLAERGGRRSWIDPAEVLSRRPYLRAQVMLKARVPRADG